LNWRQMVIEGKHPAVDATISPSLEPAVQIAVFRYL
jgi:hypothetical protein